MNTRLYLARHGQTLWNTTQRFQGQLDSDLTLIGKQQSVNIANQLLDKNIVQIISSPLGRATASAKICQQQLHVPITVLDTLIERHLGDWQGKHVDEMKTNSNYHEILHEFTELKPRHGESALQCGNRIYQALETLAKNHQDKNLLIICHGEALRCLLAKLGQNSTNNAYQLFDNGCLLTLNYHHDGQKFSLTST